MSLIISSFRDTNSNAHTFEFCYTGFVYRHDRRWGRVFWSQRTVGGNCSGIRNTGLDDEAPDMYTHVTRSSTVQR